MKTLKSKGYKVFAMRLFIAGLIFFGLSLQTVYAAEKEAAKNTKDSAAANSPATADANSSSKDAATEEAGKASPILDTLNQTLIENKKLRKELESLRTNLDEITLENNMLRFEGRKSKSTVERLENEKQSANENMKKELQEAQKVIETINQETKPARDLNLGNHKEASDFVEENKKLKTLLKSAILESEKKEYFRMVEESTKAGREAVKKISSVERENQKMKAEMAKLCYNLGNTFFEAHRYQDALQQFKRAAELNPDDSWTQYNLAVIYDYYLPNRKLALNHYRKYLKMKPAKEEIEKIREKVLDLELGKEIIPNYPIKLTYDDYQKKLEKYHRPG